MSHIFRLVSCTLFTCVFATPLLGQAVATYDENSQHPLLVGDYGQPGAAVTTPSSIVFDVTPQPPFESFGGAALAFYVPVIDFSPSNYRLETRFRVLEGNTVPVMGGVLADNDGPSSLENWIYSFDISRYSPADSWITLSRSLNQPDAIPVNEGDGVLNPGLSSLAVVAGWPGGPGARFHLELDYLRIVPVPEPGAIGLLGMGAGTLACRLWRRR